jgi:peptidoglycan/LPS O-acetylase OafA/YrhL
MSETSRSKRRITLGLFAILMGCISLIGLSSTSYYFGLGIFGGAYGAVMIALGVALIAKKEAVTN